eukprot:CAMPEP_0114608392 /NCGR_PEP_ID=MMETSP0168-20121206/2556_1 /TAXON_ID=95228 ORGANISM="Vannella sp., Strain DIVA3 517/6/12" /NCGR_SAMPLE_ID=MMETSP0168 /ASSEMBLY_ACC=CAM_ASM_000044 /LENGTH=402 /DNA_ID=CAMNT_0001819291 /DNA_START=22 /DNA_END=1227 /DNA_ORIENTATION=-
MADTATSDAKAEQTQRRRIFRIVLTGGPCAGKTTALSMISDHFSQRGWNVFRSPEANTVLVTGGVSWASLNPEQIFSFQVNVLRTMMQMEDTFMDVARLSTTDAPFLILCDRGVMDPAAYNSKEDFIRMLDALGIDSVTKVKDERYDMVVHLVTAAEGAEAHYRLDNNAARTESLDMAREVDFKLQRAWLGHPYFTIINNREQEPFKGKIWRAVNAISNRLGEEAGTSVVKRRFLVSSTTPCWQCIVDTKQDMTGTRADNCVDKASHKVDFLIKISSKYTYLIDAESDLQRLRKQGRSGLPPIYTHVTRPFGASRADEVARLVTKRQYKALCSMIMPGTRPVVVTKWSFVYAGLHYLLLEHPTRYKAGKPLLILETYEDRDRELELPTHLINVEKEVTGDLE